MNNKFKEKFENKLLKILKKYDIISAQLNKTV